MKKLEFDLYDLYLKFSQYDSIKSPQIVLSIYRYIDMPMRLLRLSCKFSSYRLVKVEI